MYVVSFILFSYLVEMWVCHLVSFSIVNEYIIFNSKVFSYKYQKINDRLNQALGDFTHKLNSLKSLFKTSLRSYNTEYTLRLYLLYIGLNNPEVIIFCHVIFLGSLLTPQMTSFVHKEVHRIIRGILIIQKIIKFTKKTFKFYLLSL